VTPTRLSVPVGEARRAVADLGPLVGFRVAGLRGRSRTAAGVALAVVAALTAGSAVLPAFMPGAVASDRAADLVALLPTAYLAFLATTALAAAVTGGGRELLPRGEGVAFPVSPITDHLGALLLAPLNLAWLAQAWSILAGTAYVAGPDGLWAVQLTVLAWLFAATAAAQAVAWAVEWVRRGPHGTVLVRTLAALLATGAAALVLTGRVAEALDRSPTRRVVLLTLDGSGDRMQWALGTALIALVGVVAVVLGARLAHAVARRAPREQLRGEGRTFAVRSRPRSDHAALVRTDRASVWRSLPLRRGLITLAVLPAVVAATGQVEWHLLPILPGIVAAGGALLFGVNAWCLDATGALWRDSLPLRPRAAFVARSRVLVEVLLVATLLPVAVAGLRSGSVPTAAEAVSLVATVVVVALQVLARAMHWSVRRPYASDLRSSRGAPAPPLAMVSYSGYLSLTSTLTGMLFVVTAQASSPWWAVLVAVPPTLLALRRLRATARAWDRSEVRGWVIVTVAAQ